MAVLAVVEDLLFLAKIESTAVQVGVALTVAKDLTALQPFLNANAGPWAVAIVDLNLSTSDPTDILTAIRRAAPTLPIVGYCAHGRTDLHANAQHAGCSVILPRSAFVKRLPELLKGHFRAPDGKIPAHRRIPAS